MQSDCTHKIESPEQVAPPTTWSGTRREFFRRWPQATLAQYHAAKNAKRIPRNAEAHQDRLQRALALAA